MLIRRVAPSPGRTEVRAGEKRLQVPSGRHQAILGELGICNKKNGHLLMSVLVEHVRPKTKFY